jgi:glyoxylase-like metal-dependent hydrolase (beta-lactamase superfamily II)
VTTLHTPGHTSVLIGSGDERALIVSDALLHPAQITEPDWDFFVDMDPPTCHQTHRHMLDRMEAEGMTMVGCHFPEPGFGRIVRLEGRRYWQPLQG